MPRQIIITGTSKGLGKELFDLLSKDRTELVSISLDFPQYQVDLAKVRKNLRLIKCDLSKSQELNKCLKELSLSKDYDEVVFINNAGVIEPIGKIDEVEQQLIERSIAVNFFSPVTITRRLVGLINEQTRLKIINISSGAALKPIDGWAMYCSTKAGFRMFLDTIASDKRLNLIVKHFDPGVMDTSMQQKIRSIENKFSSQERFISLRDEGKLRNPADVALEIIQDLL